MPDGAPEKVHCVALTSSTIQVSWHPTETHLRNGIIKGYKVTGFLDTKKYFAVKELPFGNDSAYERPLGISS